jgi:hypothetical protein
MFRKHNPDPDMKLTGKSEPDAENFLLDRQHYLRAKDQRKIGQDRKKKLGQSPQKTMFTRKVSMCDRK